MAEPDPGPPRVPAHRRGRDLDPHLGQGVGNAVGFALAEAHLAAQFNRPSQQVVDHHTYFIAGDGDMEEGISSEAAWLAGYLGLGKLIGIYDDNEITIEGPTDLAFHDDVGKRFESYGWSVHRLEINSPLERIKLALEEAKSVTDRPSLVVLPSRMGYGSPNKQDTASAHGSPLGEGQIKLTKEALGWPYQEPFTVPAEVYEHFEAVPERGIAEEEEREENFTPLSRARRARRSVHSPDQAPQAGAAAGLGGAEFRAGRRSDGDPGCIREGVQLAGVSRCRNCSAAPPIWRRRRSPTSTSGAASAAMTTAAATSTSGSASTRWGRSSNTLTIKDIRAFGATFPWSSVIYIRRAIRLTAVWMSARSSSSPTIRSGCGRERARRIEQFKRLASLRTNAEHQGHQAGQRPRGNIPRLALPARRIPRSRPCWRLGQTESNDPRQQYDPRRRGSTAAPTCYADADGEPDLDNDRDGLAEMSLYLKRPRPICSPPTGSPVRVVSMPSTNRFTDQIRPTAIRSSKRRSRLGVSVEADEPFGWSRWVQRRTAARHRHRPASEHQPRRVNVCQGYGLTPEPMSRSCPQPAGGLLK